MNDPQAVPHCPRCRSSEIVEVVKLRKDNPEMQCDNCGLAFLYEETLNGVDPDL